MDWSGNSEIITAQLNSSSPEWVFDALEEYGRVLAGDRLACGIDFLEQTLAARKNKLIDLGLAKNGFNVEIVAGLYARAKCGSDDPIHDKAVRLACLLNINAAGYPGFDASALTSEEMDRLIREGGDDEISALMHNSSRRESVAQAFGKTGPFAEIENSRWLGFVAAGAGNPSLTFDNSNEDGPDHLAMDIQRSILLLVQQAPVEEVWAHVIDRILFQIDPEKLWLPSSEVAAKELLERWGRLNTSGDGYYTHLPWHDEFQILLAIMFGGYTANIYDRKTIGSPIDPDQAMRCAYYARSPMSVEEMESARVKDGFAFLFAAIFNKIFHYEPARRNYLESMLSDELRLLYVQRYKIQADINPNERTLASQFDSVTLDLVEIKSQIKSIKSYLVICLIALVLLILFKH